MFITLEGIEGSGKTTQMAQVASFFESKGFSCHLTKEPGGTRIGQRIRAILLDPENSDMDPTCEMLLYMADRAQHLCQLLGPAKNGNNVVVSDRYVDATAVYQGASRGLGTERVWELHRLLFNNFLPDLTLLLDLDVETGLARAWHQIDSGGRTGLETRFEQETLAFHQRVRDGYLSLARKNSDRYRVINADAPQHQVTQDIESALSEFLETGFFEAT